MAKKVAIIGGGWIGLQVAMNLEKADPKGEAVEVTIFDAKKHFYNNVAGLRLCVEPEFIVKAVVPRDQALKRSKIIQAEVETIIPDGPALKLKARDEAIPADFIVLATGTRYPFPGKVPWWLGHMAAGRMYQKIRDRISRAKKIVIVGGGPTGVELAGELCEFFPEISTTLVHSGDRLMHTYHGVGKDQVLKTTTTDKIRARIEKMGCNVVLNERIVIDSGGKTGLAAGEGDGVDDSSMAAKETETFMQDRTEDLKAESGRTFPADLVFYCTGTTANSDVYTNVFKVGEGNRVACDEYLRCRLADDSGSAPAVYAAGDCCLSKFIDGQHTGPGMIHAQVVSDNIMAAVKGEAKVEYNPKPKKRAPDMIVTHGTKGATAEIGGNNGWLMTQVGKSLKAKDLYTKHLWKEYKLQGKPPKTEREMQAGGCFGGGGKKVSPNAKKYQASSSSQW